MVSLDYMSAKLRGGLLVHVEKAIWYIYYTAYPQLCCAISFKTIWNYNLITQQ